MSYIALDTADLVLASALILINGALSIAFRLGLERTLAIAALRMVVQLTLVGLVLKFVFDANSPLITAAVAMVMALAAAYEVISRQTRRIAGLPSLLLAGGTPFAAGLVGTLFAVMLLIKPDPWFAPRYILPILGMVIGNTLSGVALALDTITEIASRERAGIEARLALGRSRFVAMADVLRRSLKTGLMPILNMMAAAGLVSLPGMMTGQIMAGIAPIDATKYQIMIMFVIGGATGLAVTIASLGAVLLLTDERHRLRLDRLQERKPGAWLKARA